MVWLSVTDDKGLENGLRLTEDQQRRRRNRSIAMALALGGLVVIMIAITLVRGPIPLVVPL